MLQNIEKSSIKKTVQQQWKKGNNNKGWYERDKIVISGFMHVIRLPKNSSTSKLNSTGKIFSTFVENWITMEFNFLGADEFNLSL